MSAVETVRICIFVSYAVFTLVISLIACVDPEGDGWHNKLAGLVSGFPEHVVWPAIGQLCGKRAEERVAKLTRWLCAEPNPVLQILYLTFVCGGYGAAVIFAYPRVPCASLGAHHKGLGMLFFASCLTSFIAASTGEPGYIVDNQTVAKHDNYAYDNVHFLPNKICSTAKVRKVARSKFCTTTWCNIARFDHFCPWINNAIGEENYRIFLLFLCCHALFLCYGAVCISFILYDLILREDLFNASFYDPRTGELTHSSRMLVLRYLVTVERVLCGLLATSIVMATVVTGFLAYHLWLIKLGRTTNEHYKWIFLKQRKTRKENKTRLFAGETFLKQTGSSSTNRTLVVDTDDVDGEIPVGIHHSATSDNAYNQGFFRNLGEVAFPRSRRADALRRARKAGKSEKAK